MKVSVIVPVYNGAQYLRECIDSILAQSHSDLEVIIVDDGSTDDSPAICDSYAASDSRVCVLHGENKGLSSARNKGIEAASGPYLSFVDADDVIHERMMEELCMQVADSGADIVSCAFCRSDKTSFRVGQNKVCTYSGDIAVKKYLYQERDSITGIWAHIFNRRLFCNARFTVGILYEDLDLLHILYRAANKVVLISDALYFYRVTTGSIINTWSRRRLDVLDVTARIERCYADNPRLLAAARDRSLSAAFNIFSLNARNENDAELAARCFRIICERRWESLKNPNVRLKNKIGVLASLPGKWFLTMLSRI